MTRDLPYEWDFSALEAIELAKPSVAKVHQCVNCRQEPSWRGWDDCIRCGTAVLRIEHPDYPTFARKHLDYTAAELEQLDEEWARQSVTVEAA